MCAEVGRGWEARGNENELRSVQACVQHVAALRSDNLVVVSLTSLILLISFRKLVDVLQLLEYHCWQSRKHCCTALSEERS